MPLAARSAHPLPCAIVLAALGALATQATARAAAAVDCQTGIDSALHRAAPLPESKGKAALMEQIQRAQIAHHEDDEGDCQDELSVATNVLDRIDAARKAKTQATPR